MKQTLFCYGFGYTARALANILPDWEIIGTTRDPKKMHIMQAKNLKIVMSSDAQLEAHISAASHLLISAAPGDIGDPLLKTGLIDGQEFDWVGYLSTTAVYGDHGGRWVDETTPPNPSTDRGQRRLQAEQSWLASGLPVHIFRLAGIYGPGRGPFAKLQNGTARRIVKDGQVFSRTHVDDIAQVLAASIAAPNHGTIYNICDDDPASPQDVIAYAAALLDLPIPPAEPFETAHMSPMAKGFYTENKRIRNDRIKNDLGVALKYPTYREGLKADLIV